MLVHVDLQDSNICLCSTGSFRDISSILSLSFASCFALSFHSCSLCQLVSWCTPSSHGWSKDLRQNIWDRKQKCESCPLFYFLRNPLYLLDWFIAIKLFQFVKCLPKKACFQGSLLGVGSYCLLSSCHCSIAQSCCSSTQCFQTLAQSLFSIQLHSVGCGGCWLIGGGCWLFQHRIKSFNGQLDNFGNVPKSLNTDHSSFLLHKASNRLLQWIQEARLRKPGNGSGISRRSGFFCQWWRQRSRHRLRLHCHYWGIFTTHIRLFPSY